MLDLFRMRGNLGEKCDLGNELFRDFRTRSVVIFFPSPPIPSKSRIVCMSKIILYFAKRRKIFTQKGI